MIELIKSIPGPYFLFIYAAVSFAVILIAKLYADYNNDNKLPDLTQLSPLSISILIKGIKGVIIFTIFKLWWRKKIEIKKNNKVLQVKRLTNDNSGLNRLETVLLQYFHIPKPYGTLFKKKSIETIKNIISSDIDDLQKYGLLTDPRTTMRLWRITWRGALILMVVGCTKLVLGVTNNKPVVYLILLIIVSLFF